MLTFYLNNLFDSTIFELWLVNTIMTLTSMLRLFISFITGAFITAEGRAAALAQNFVPANCECFVFTWSLGSLALFPVRPYIGGGGWYVAPKFLLASLGMNFFIGKAKNSNSSTVMVFYWRCLTKILGITLCPFKILGHGPPMNAFCVIVN